MTSESIDRCECGQPESLHHTFKTPDADVPFMFRRIGASCAQCGLPGLPTHHPFKVKVSDDDWEARAEAAANETSWHHDTIRAFVAGAEWERASLVPLVEAAHLFDGPCQLVPPNYTWCLTHAMARPCDGDVLRAALAEVEGVTTMPPSGGT